jgi:preprotein translocase subunit Sec61beta
MDERDPAGGSDRARGREAGFLETVRAVLWSFFGVRRKADYEKDAARLNPVHVIIAGLAVAALLVLTLILIVRAVAG